VGGIALVGVDVETEAGDRLVGFADIDLGNIA
jgi:hypothetical protein